MPHFEGLSKDDILKWAEKFPEVFEYLPPEEERMRLPREYLIDLVYTIVGEPFAKWVDECVAERNANIKAQNN